MCDTCFFYSISSVVIIILNIIIAPIVTYILGPNEGVEVPFYGQKSLEDGTELCENVTYLGEFTIFIESLLQIMLVSLVDVLYNSFFLVHCQEKQFVTTVDSQ